MGKLKNALIVEQENFDAMRRIYEKSMYADPRMAGITEPSDEELAQWDKEFNAWLDTYEQSFGSNL